jgi:PD-(D/E)XK nuclease superfamily
MWSNRIVVVAALENYQHSFLTQPPHAVRMLSPTKYRPYFSYKLWADSEPAFNLEAFHCPMQRGFRRVRNREPIVKALIATDSDAQAIGHLAQRGVYEFHADPQLLDRSDGVKLVADLLQLKHLDLEIAERVTRILKRYHTQPILKGKQILRLERGDEELPAPLLLKLQRKEFNFYAAMDCVYIEPDGTIHILDFKTGKSKFDERQAYTYLFAARHLYPGQPVVASFYNLESQQGSRIITASPVQLHRMEIIFASIAQQLADDKNHYRNNPAAFNLIFRPNPGVQCQHCPFPSICDYAEHDSTHSKD